MRIGISFATRRDRWLGLAFAAGACAPLPNEVPASESVGASQGSGTSLGSMEPVATATPSTGGVGVTGPNDTSAGSGDASATSSSGTASGSTTATYSPLVDRGLVARYFIDEAADGQLIEALDDSAPEPLPLPLVYDEGQPRFVENDGGRGLYWGEESSVGVARVRVGTSKVRRMLDGSRTATIELVVDPDEVGEQGITSRFMYIGQQGESGQLLFGATKTEGFRVRLNGMTVAEWKDIDVGSLGRSVVHVVLDTQVALNEERVRLYIDGVEQSPSQLLTVEGSISVTPMERFTLGNWPDGSRSMEGTLYYAAIYATALGPSEIENNRAVLADDDDAS